LDSSNTERNEQACSAPHFGGVTNCEEEEKVNANDFLVDSYK
jgi:hypothetical protein